MTWSTTSDTTCSSSTAAPGSTVAFGPVRTSTRIGSSVASTASSSSAESRAGAPGRRPGVDAREQQQGFRVVAHAPRGVDQLGQAGRLGGERVGPHPVHQPHVAVDPLPQPPQHVGGHVAAAASAVAAGTGAGPLRPFSRVAVLWRPTFAESPSVANMSSPTIGPLEWGSAARAPAVPLGRR